MKRYFTILMFSMLICSPVSVFSTHLMGGELTYKYDGAHTGGAYYIIRLTVYRYCDTTQITPAPLDPSMKLGVFIVDSLNPTNTVYLYNSDVLFLTNSSLVESLEVPNCPFQSSSCIQLGVYEERIYLVNKSVGYHLFVERCCRNNNIINLVNPGSAGMSFYTFIPPGVINSSPQITSISVPYICTGETVTIINNAFDPDGDSLSYAFEIPDNGVSGQLGNSPNPIDYSPYVLPIPDVTFAPGYSSTNIFGAGGSSTIDPVTGLIEFYVANQGFYVAAVEIKEYRNGVLLSTTRRDLQFIAIVCPPNPLPIFTVTGNGGVYNVVEDQQLCFNVSATDAGGDSLYLTGFGPLLNINVTNPPGVLPDATGLGTVTSQFCWTPICGMSRPAPYQFSVVVTDNGCPRKSISNVFSVNVTPGTGTLIPTVSILQQPIGMLCQGSTVSFTASANYPGINPQFSWFINGILVAGISDSVFTSTQINDGDIVTVTMVTNAGCLITNSATSPPLIMNVDAQPAPQVVISSSPGQFACPSQDVNFSSSVLNGGASPSFQWNLNGFPAGQNLPIYNASGTNGTIAVFLTLTPSTGCPSENSNLVLLTIMPSQTPTIEMTSGLTGFICAGQTVSFTATSTNTIEPPEYYWTLNGNAVGDSSGSITLQNLQENDTVIVSVTSDYACLSPVFTISDPYVAELYPPLSGDLTDGPVEICYGIPLQLDYIASGGNTSIYIYNWSNSNSNVSTAILYPDTSGYYFASVTDGCSNIETDSIYIEVLPSPVANFNFAPLKPSVFFPEVHFTNQSVDETQWFWDFGDEIYSFEEHPLHVYNSAGNFNSILIVTNDYGCSDTTNRIIHIENIITCYIPNSFTPNGDGINDFFSAIGNSDEGYEMSIFNRWGEEIFKSNGAFDKWEGVSLKGEESPQGTYIYVLKVRSDKSGKLYTGTVNLVR